MACCSVCAEKIKEDKDLLFRKKFEIIVQVILSFIYWVISIVAAVTIEDDGVQPTDILVTILTILFIVFYIFYVIKYFGGINKNTAIDDTIVQETIDGFKQSKCSIILFWFLIFWELWRIVTAISLTVVYFIGQYLNDSIAIGILGIIFGIAMLIVGLANFAFSIKIFQRFKIGCCC